MCPLKECFVSSVVLHMILHKMILISVHSVAIVSINFQLSIIMKAQSIFIN